MKFVNKEITDKQPSRQHQEHKQQISTQITDDSKRNQEKQTKNNEEHSVNTIDLNKELDKKRQEIGFETESLLDTDWRQVKVDYNKLIVNYAKLSKKNLTG
jgi:hypothetical protein